MTVEITEVLLETGGLVTIFGVDCSEENLQRMERTRDDGFEKAVEFRFDTKQPKSCTYLYKWLKAQKAAKGKDTWGAALQAVVGTVTTINAKYRNWE